MGQDFEYLNRKETGAAVLATQPYRIYCDQGARYE